MDQSYNLQRGRVSWKQGETYYELFNPSKSTSQDEVIVLIHGGPGSNHLFYRPFCEKLAENYSVLVYDQVGGGFSSGVKNPSKLTVQVFVEELSQLQKKLKLKKMHLFSHSWGAAVATEYTAKYPNFVASNIFLSPYFSTESWIRGTSELVNKLPVKHRNAISRAHLAKDFDSKAFKEATNLFNSLHLRRIDVFYPERAAGAALFNVDIYRTLWGASEFVCEGKLKSYDATPKLKKIDKPALFICGEFDETLPRVLKEFSDIVKGSKFKILKGIAHCAHYEKPVALKKEITNFISRNKKR